MKTNGDPWCRTCNHAHWQYIETLEVDECANPKCKCTAEDWACIDNLVYLESLVDKIKNKQ